MKGLRQEFWLINSLPPTAMPLGIRPTNDFAFKKIFGTAENRVALISLLNAILKLKSPIVEVTLENSHAGAWAVYFRGGGPGNRRHARLLAVLALARPRVRARGTAEV
ncbi:MAG: PD-(D/E)XK nuclease family transposase, partial [Thermoguttaceae bacterium]